LLSFHAPLFRGGWGRDGRVELGTGAAKKGGCVRGGGDGGCWGEDFLRPGGIERGTKFWGVPRGRTVVLGMAALKEKGKKKLAWGGKAPRRLVPTVVQGPGRD